MKAQCVTSFGLILTIVADGEFLRVELDILSVKIFQRLLTIRMG